jgi:hypothetical protein
VSPITVDDLAPADTVRRDRWGRYLVTPPDGGKPVGYTRATTPAKTLDDQHSLINWGKRMTAVGLATRPDLMALVAAADPTDKRELDKLCERASEAGGATARRDLGTALHSMVERKVADPTWQPPAIYADDVAAILGAIDDAGYDIVVEFSEQILVLDEYRVAGKCDFLLRHRVTGEHVVADLKTGSTVIYSGLAFAIQLSIYANADCMYVQGDAKDGSEDVRLPLPTVNRDRALILHAQPESGHCDIYSLDITAGFEAFKVALDVREWRSRSKTLLTPIEGDGADTTSVPVVGPVEEPTTAVAPNPAGEGDGTAAGAPSPDRTAWILGRVDAVKAIDGGKDALRTAWSVAHARTGGVMPALPGDIRAGKATWSADDIEALAAILDDAETAVEASFPDQDPSVEPFAAPVADDAKRVTVTPAAYDASVLAPRDACEALRDRFNKAHQDVKDRLMGAGAWEGQARRAGATLIMGRGPDVAEHRYALCLAAFSCAERLVDYEDDSEDHVRLALSLVIGAEHAMSASLPVGALLGCLTTDEANELVGIAWSHIPATKDGTAVLIAA